MHYGRTTNHQLFLESKMFNGKVRASKLQFMRFTATIESSDATLLFR